MSDTAITATLDRERQLDVRPHLIELERTTGVGVGRLVARVIAGDYHVTDLSETVRLGLLGAGTSPAEAATLARVYVTERPLHEGHALATEILLAAWNGTRKAVAPAPEDAEAGDVILVDGNRRLRVNNDGSTTEIEPAR